MPFTSAQPKLHFREPGRQAHLRRASVRTVHRVRTRTPSIGLTSLCSEVGHVDQHNRKSCRDLNTGSRPTETRLVRGMDLRNPLLAFSRRHRNAVARPREDASNQSLQPTCCHEYPLEHATSKLRTFALPTAATCARPSARAFARVSKTRPSTATSIGRCRRPRPWMVTQLTLRLQLLPISPPRRAARCPELDARRGIVRPTRAR